MKNLIFKIPSQQKFSGASPESPAAFRAVLGSDLSRARPEGRVVDKTGSEPAGAPENFCYRRNFENQVCNKGFTLVELLVSIFIISLLTVVINSFARDVFYDSYALSDSMSAQFDARHVVGVMANSLREAAPSSLGAYPLVLAGDSAITFYSDLNNDGLEEQIRYFVSGSTLQQGIVVPTGSPLSYNQSNEKISTLASGMVSSSTRPIFQYFPNTYAGTSSPLTQPVNISGISFVRITVIIDKNTNHSPAQAVFTSGVSLRNLKSNQ